MTFTKTLLTSTALVGMMAGAAAAQTEINWWHAMGGANGERVDRMAEEFNAMQDELVLVPT